MRQAAGWLVSIVDSVGPAAMTRVRVAARPIAVALLILLASSRSAWAHGALRSSVPANGSRLNAAPRELRLTFTEVPEVAVARVTLTGPDGMPVALDALRAVADSPQVLVAPISGALSAGSYTVDWQITGKDGHPVRGRITFTIAAGATELGTPLRDSVAASLPAEQTGDSIRSEAAPEGAALFDAESPAYALIRFLTFGALLVVIGAVSFQLLVLGFLGRRYGTDAPFLVDAGARAASIGRWAAWVLVVAALGRLYAQAYALAGGPPDGSLVVAVLRRTLWGWAWAVQVLGAATVARSLGPGRRGRGPRWELAAFAAVVLALTPGLSGHAASVPGVTAVAVVADAGHVLGAAGWLGTLLLVVAAGMSAARRLPEAEQGAAVAALVNAFSPVALVCAGTAAATGVLAAWLQIGSVSGLWLSPYGRTLLLKVGILSVVAFTGFYNWQRVKPRLGDLVGAQRIRRTASLEIVIAVVVLAVTAVLVATPTPREEMLMDHEQMSMTSMTGP